MEPRTSANSGIELCLKEKADEEPLPLFQDARDIDVVAKPKIIPRMGPFRIEEAQSHGHGYICKKGLSIYSAECCAGGSKKNRKNRAEEAFYGLPEHVWKYNVIAELGSGASTLRFCQLPVATICLAGMSRRRGGHSGA